MNESASNNQDAPPRLRVKKDVSPGARPHKPCPQCEADMPEDAVLCVKCGYDARSGKRLKTRAWPHVFTMAASIFASLVVVTVGIVILVGVLGGDRADPPLPEPVAPAEPTARPAPSPTPTEPTDDEEIVDAEDEQEEPADQVEDDDTPREEPETVSDEPAAEDEIQEVLREQLRAGLDERLPMYAMGDEVALRRTNGLVHRGQLAGVRDGFALVVDGEQRERVRLDELDRDSRLRLEAELRERFVEHRLQQILNSQ